MSIGINGGSPFGGVQTSGPVLGAGLKQDKDGDHDVSSRVSGGSSRGGGLMQNVVQSLGQLGLASPSQVVSPANGQDPQQAMHSFMHSLYQALNQSGAQPTNGQSGNATGADQKNSTTKANAAALKSALAAYGADKNGSSKTATVQSSYTDIENNLQNLLKNVSSNSSNPIVADLSSKFSNLVQALKSGQSAAPTAQAQTQTQTPPASSKVTLQNFLQDMIQNTSNPLSASGLGSSGNLISIKV